MRTCAWAPALLLCAASCGAPANREDCSSQQGWSDEALASVRVEATPASPVTPTGSGLNASFSTPVALESDGGQLTSLVVSNGPLSFPVSVESADGDGGSIPFEVHVFVDGEPWGIELRQDGGVVSSPSFGPNAVADFEMSVGAPSEPGAHDLVLLLTRREAALFGGIARTWLNEGTQPLGAQRQPVEATLVSRTGAGSSIRTADGLPVFRPNRYVPNAGQFVWTVHLEEESSAERTTCKGSNRTYRLFALLDGAPWAFSGNQYHVDIEVPVGAAGEAQISFDGLPGQTGHVLSILKQQNPGRFQVRPDGELSPWYDPLVTELGATGW